MSPEERSALIRETVDVFFTYRMCGAPILKAATFIAETYWPRNVLTEPPALIGNITKRLSSSVWRRLRARVLERDQFTCSYCLEECDADKLCVDHVVPISRGGGNEDANLVACCRPCNSSKSAKLLSDWRGRRL